MAKASKPELAVTRRWASRIVGHEEVAPDQLLGNPFNWRVHSMLQQGLMEKTLDTVGWLDEVMVNRVTGHMIDGHMRVLLAMRANEPLVPVRYVELSPDEEKIALRTYDAITELSDVDREKLEALHKDTLAMPAVTDDERATRLMDELWNASPLALAKARMEAIQGGGAGSSPGELNQIPTTAVRVVQLFLTEQTVAEFRELVGKLQPIFGADSPADTVMRALRDAAGVLLGDGSAPH